jgi:hypothetical protein
MLNPKGQRRRVPEQRHGTGRHLGDADPLVLEVVHDAEEEAVLVRVTVLELLLHRLDEEQRVIHRRRRVHVLLRLTTTY